MVITSAERQKHNKDRYSIFVDGKYEFSVSEEDYIRLGLYEEKELTPEDIDYIRNSVNFNSAKYTAIKFVSMKIRTACEVEKKLEEKGFDGDTIIAAIEELKAMGYINDKLYVERYLLDRTKLKPKSQKLLSIELQDKGIETAIIEEIMETWEFDDAAVAESLIRKKFGRCDMSLEKNINKAYAFLRNRGFGFSLIKKVVQNIAEEETKT